MKFLFLDFETTWTQPVDATKCNIIEIGAVLYCPYSRVPEVLNNTLVYHEAYGKIPPELENLTGISQELLEREGMDPKLALIELNKLIKKSTHVVAHNGTKFDKIVYEKECERHGLEVIDRVWIDTKLDIPYPDTIKTRKLTYLAAEHGFLNPFTHRALFDCLTMLKVFEKYQYDKVIQNAKSPIYRVIAQVSYDDRHLAKERGYYWDGEKKVWYKELKESFVKKEKEEAPFNIVTIKEE